MRLRKRLPFEVEDFGEPRPRPVADLDPRLEAFVAAGNFSPDLGARYLEFENLRQDTAYDFLLRPPTTASSGRFLCHEVPLSANIARGAAKCQYRPADARRLGARFSHRFQTSD